LSGQRARGAPAFQRLARFQDIGDQDDERFAFAAIATHLLTPRRFVFRVAAMDQPVAVARLAATFAFWRGIAGVWHSNLKKGGGGYPWGYPPSTLPPKKARRPKTLATFDAKINIEKVNSLFFFRRSMREVNSNCVA
jgi:hypothetical protein